MSDEARERAIVGYFEPLSHGGSVSDHEIARAFWDAAVAHHFEPCGVPTEPSKYFYEYWLWANGQWEAAIVDEVDGRCYTPIGGEDPWCDEFPPEHWRRMPLMPAPPSQEG